MATNLSNKLIIKGSLHCQINQSLSEKSNFFFSGLNNSISILSMTASYFWILNLRWVGLPWWLRGKESAHSAGDLGSILGWEDPLKKQMAMHSSILAWKIPWTEDPGRLQSMGSQRVEHDWTTNTLLTF